jgi:hypothetical protein
MNYYTNINVWLFCLSLFFSVLFHACEEKNIATGNHGGIIDSTGTIEPRDQTAVGTEPNSGSGVLGTGTSAIDAQRREMFPGEPDSTLPGPPDTTRSTSNP